jgi:hypothetical protein
MRRLILTAALALLLAGPALAQDTPPDPGQDRGETQTRPNLRDAVTAPLDDLNLKQVNVPDVLKRAVAEPYAMGGLDRCEAIAGEIGRLDEALGPDLDEAPPPDTRTRGQKIRQAAGDAAVGAIGAKAHGLLPFRGWIRKLTGAERRDRRVAAAVRAGQIRRGYLKGAGMRMNCAPPAAPSWFEPKAAGRAEAGRAVGGLLAWLGGVLAAIIGWLKGLLGG